VNDAFGRDHDGEFLLPSLSLSAAGVRVLLNHTTNRAAAAAPA